MKQRLLTAIAALMVFSIATSVYARGDGGLPLALRGGGDGSLPLRATGLATERTETNAVDHTARIEIRSVSEAAENTGSETCQVGVSLLAADGAVVVGASLYQIYAVCADQEGTILDVFAVAPSGERLLLKGRIRAQTDIAPMTISGRLTIADSGEAQRRLQFRAEQQ